MEPVEGILHGMSYLMPKASYAACFIDIHNTATSFVWNMHTAVVRISCFMLYLPLNSHFFFEFVFFLLLQGAFPMKGQILDTILVIHMSKVILMFKNQLSDYCIHIEQFLGATAPPAQPAL